MIFSCLLFLYPPDINVVPFSFLCALNVSDGNKSSFYLTTYMFSEITLQSIMLEYLIPDKELDSRNLLLR